jgi:hypothetical protein
MPYGDFESFVVCLKILRGNPFNLKRRATHRWRARVRAPVSVDQRPRAMRTSTILVCRRKPLFVAGQKRIRPEFSTLEKTKSHEKIVSAVNGTDDPVSVQ